MAAAKELSKSSSNLNEVLHSGRPRNEEAHVKRTSRKKAERVEYIVRVDLDALRIDDDAFDDLLGLYKIFDVDKDGILSFKEYERLLKCLGYRLSECEARMLASSVSVDTTQHSVSFNEFLTLIANQQQVEPDQDTLIAIFQSFDKDGCGMISEEKFKQIMSGKDDVKRNDVDEMLNEYFSMASTKGLSTSAPDGTVATPSSSSSTPRAHRRPSSAIRRPSSSARRPLSASRRPSSAVAAIEEAIDETNERWIDYRAFVAMLQE